MNRAAWSSEIVMRRTIASAFVGFGVLTTLLWFLLLFGIWKWYTNVNPTSLTLAIATVNLVGLGYLLLNRRNQPLWLVIVGVTGNSISLGVTAYSTLGYLFLKNLFRM